MSIFFEKHIIELLALNNCVIVPNLGGFISQSVPAGFNEKYTVSPPSKLVSFNGSLQSNDGLLTYYISRLTNKPYSEIEKETEIWVQDIKNELKEKKSFDLEGLGKLWMEEGKIRFNPDSHGVIFTHTYGLTPIRVNEIVRSKKEKIATPITSIESEKKIVSIKRPRKKGYRWAAVLVPASLILAGFLSTESKENLAFLPSLPNVFNAKETFSSRLNVLKSTDFEIKISESPSTFALDQAYATYELNGEKLIIHNTKAEAQFKRNHHVIGGCFQFLENAERAVSQFREKGYNAHIICKKFDLYHVSISSFPNRKEAMKVAREINKETGLKAWVSMSN